LHCSAVPHGAPAESVPAGNAHASGDTGAHVGAAAFSVDAHASAADSVAEGTPAAPRRDSQKVR
jgi:hypothetical protein